MVQNIRLQIEIATRFGLKPKIPEPICCTPNPRPTDVLESKLFNPILELPIRVFLSQEQEEHQPDPAALSPAAMATKASTLLRAARKASLASRAAAAAASRAAAMASHSARLAGLAADVARTARLCSDLKCHPKSCINHRFPTSADYEHLPGKPTLLSSLFFG
jgi:hypothetical protein